MKRLFITLLLFISFSMSSQNYSFFENDIRLANSGNSEGSSIVTLTHFGFFPITEKFGFADYVSIEGNDQYEYGQVLLGGYYNITDKLSTYIMVGKESVSSEGRFGYMLYFTTGDKIRTYAFYQRNKNPFSPTTQNSEWYDIMFRYAIKSEINNSFYLGARVMKGYGTGIPITLRQRISDGDSVYLSYTTYYDETLSDFPWRHTLTLVFEFY